MPATPPADKRDEAGGTPRQANLVSTGKRTLDFGVLIGVYFIQVN
jgi:hypothetical protein